MTDEFKFKLDTGLYERIQALTTDLRDFADEARDAWAGKSGRWQESDKGQNTDAWIESLENLADELDGTETEPET